MDLYILMNFGFNYQLRFNSQHEFNNPFGKDRSSFNQAIKSRLKPFMEQIKPYYFSSLDFRDFDFSLLKENDLIYCDPPYTISVGSYNDGKRGFNGWQHQDDIDLMIILDELSDRGVHFALSNVIFHKGEINVELTEWAKKYTIHELNYNYNNRRY
ncbi:MAG: DNA adenine methylase [Ruminococcus sp.]|nr:DNA adenine methylase [Ruminococcus sp.]